MCNIAGGGSQDNGPREERNTTTKTSPIRDPHSQWSQIKDQFQGNITIFPNIGLVLTLNSMYCQIRDNF